MTNRNPEEISEIYEALIDSLDLVKEHKDSLDTRGFSLAHIEDNQYRTYPFKRKDIATKLDKEFDITGVPGFWRGLDGKPDLAGMSGLLIPIRDIEGNIVGFKIRSDKSTNAAHKYSILSSKPGKDERGEPRFPGGTAANLNIHYPIGARKLNDTIRITEGELKADLATIQTAIYTISLPGINVWRMALEPMKKLKPKEIRLAFDSDKNDAKSSSNQIEGEEEFVVGKTLAQLYLALVEQGHNVRIETWDREFGKGIDDVINNGYQDRIVIMSDDEAQEFCVKMLKTTMPLEWVYIIQSKRFVCKNSLVELDKEQFSDKYAAEFKSANSAQKMMLNPSFPRVDMQTYEPNQDKILDINGIKHFNFWRPGRVMEIQGDVSPFMNHMMYLIPDERERNIVLDWLAFNIQKPGEKILWALLIQGIPGTGKSFIGYIMRELLGHKNVSMPSNEAIHESFTAWQKNCSLIIVEELMARGRLELMNKLKPMITQPTCQIREMYRNPYEQRNVFNMLVFTNHEDAIIIDEDDRRYCVIFSPAKKMDEEYYTKLWDWTKSSLAAINFYLQNRDISKFNPNSSAPMTLGKKKLIMDSTPSILGWMNNGIESNMWPFTGDLINVMDLIEFIPKVITGNYPPSPQLIGKYLKMAGAEQLDKKVKVEGKGLVRLWALRRAAMWNMADPVDVVNMYMKWVGTDRPIELNPLKEHEPV